MHRFGRDTVPFSVSKGDFFAVQDSKAPVSTSAFHAAEKSKGNGQSHHLPALLEVLHNSQWPSLSARP